MNTKRSYLDSLNAGRRRRSSTTLDDISETLSALEQRIADSKSIRKESREDRRPMREPERQTRSFSARPDLPRSTGYGAPTTSADRAGESARAQSEGYAAIHRISEELHALRDDLRRELNVGMKREFEGLRDLLASIYAEAGSTRAGNALMPELDRIAEAVETLSARGNIGDAKELRAEIEDLKHAIDDLAREESVQSLKSRWNDFDRRWDSIESHLHQRTDVDQRQQRAIDALDARLDSILEAVAGLPESLPLRSLDDKIRTLSDAINHVGDRPALPSNLLDAVEERLDEISRAISATASAPATIDTTPIERIEARIGSLSKQIAEIIEPGPGFSSHLQELSDRIDAIAGRIEMPDQAIDRVTKQLAVITDRLEADQPPTDMTVLLQGVEDRILSLSEALQRSTDDVASRSHQMFSELEHRLEDLAGRFEARAGTGDGDGSSAILADLETRFDKLAARLDADTARSETALRTAFDDRFREMENQLASSRSSGDGLQTGAIDQIEARLDALADKMENRPASDGPHEDVIRNLEAQIANISSYIADSENREPGLDSLSPRLDEIERALAGNHERIMEAARMAAEDALKSVSAHGDGSSAAVAALAEDLKELDTLARRSDERNTKTFEAIHETLMKIVDRLESLEDKKPAPVSETPQSAAPAKARKVEVESAPGMEAGVDDLLVAEPSQDDRLADTSADGDKRTPAEAAAAAAFAALKASPPPATDDDKKKRSMLGGLSRALKGKKDKPKDEPPAEEAEAKVVAVDEPEFEAPADSDEPLEPGSGAPDLGAIMKRVRAEHENPAKRTDPDAAKADFIAAARRAAQAAASEAKVLKGKSEKTKSGNKLAIGSLLADKRRPLLIAAGAIMIALAGYQLSKSFFNDKPAAVAQKSTKASGSKTTAKSAPKTTGDKAAADKMADKAAEDGKAMGEETVPPNVRVVDTGKSAQPQTPDTPKPAMADGVTAADAVKPEAAKAPADAAPMAEAPMATAANAPAGLSIDFGPQALRDAVANGDPKAYFEVASLYADGRGVKADLGKAAEWYTHAADAGFAPAEYRIGNFYEKGLGVERDIKAAKTWYQMAAEQGNVSAMHNLAVLFAMGADGTPDNESAVRWFRQAADHGVKDSQFNLAILAAKGVGMKQDLIESYKWFAVAAQNGDKDAAEKRDEVAKALRPEQLDKARAEADLWKPEPVDTAANTFEAPDAWNGAPEATAAIDMKKAIRNIQIILNKNGFDAGAPDGIMGNQTKQAIKDFQKANNMPVTGEVDEPLVRALLEKK